MTQMNKRLETIRESERKSHTEIYTKEKLYETDSWLKKPIKTVQELMSLFCDRHKFRVLDLGCGVGRNSIYVAKEFSGKECRIDCVDLLLIAIEKLNEYASDYGVTHSINGIVSSIEDYKITAGSYDLIMAVSALEHVDGEDSFYGKLQEIKEGTAPGGVVCLVINSEVTERDINRGEELVPQFEVNLSTERLKACLNDSFAGWKVLKNSISKQEYEIPRGEIISRLSTSVVTYVAQKI